MREASRRIDREKKTIAAMVTLYCKDHHRRKSVCPECSGLVQYSLARLSTCRFRDMKPTCAKCPIHCYSPAMRESVRAVMRYSGPRMILHHPFLAFMHLLDARSKPPPQRGGG
jgi:hypothetical protein